MKYEYITSCIKEKAVASKKDDAGEEYYFTKEEIVLWINKKPYAYGDVIQINTSQELTVRGSTIFIGVICKETINEVPGEIVQLRANMRIPLRNINNFGISTDRKE